MEKRGKIIILAAVLILGLAAGIWAGWRYYDATYLWIDGVQYRRDITELDLSGREIGQLERVPELEALQKLDLRDTGLTAEEFEMIHGALPECQIQWKVPFQGDCLDLDAQSLTVTTLTEEDVETLDYLTQLEYVDATGCQDYDAIMSLIRRRPECEVSYKVIMGKRQYDPSRTELIIHTDSPQEVGQALQYMPWVTKVYFPTAVWELEDLLALEEAYPDIAFNWRMNICGVIAEYTDTELDLSGIPLETVEEVEKYTSAMPNLEKVYMIGCGIPNEEMGELNQRHENIQYVWEVALGTYIRLRTDATFFMPTKLGHEVNDWALGNLRYCTELVCLDLGHMDVKDLSFLQYMPKLKYLIVADNDLKDITYVGTLKELIYLELFITKVTDYSPLLGCTKLEDLNICYTQGDPEIISQMTWLKRLWWSGSGLTWPQMTQLMEALPDTQIVFNTLSSTGKGWRQGQNYYDMRDMVGMWYMTY